MSILSTLFRKNKPVELEKPAERDVLVEPEKLVEDEPIPKLHIFVDGSWLYRTCQTGIFARELVYPQTFKLDFNKLNAYLLNHIKRLDSAVELGDCHFVMSIFDVPVDIDSWVGKEALTQEDIEFFKEAVSLRQNFTDAAIMSGFYEKLLHPVLAPWIVQKFLKKEYREKQADTAIAALLTEYSITQPYDYFALITGDADMVSCIKVALEHTKNLFLVTTHHDEFDPKHRSSAYEFSNIDFSIPTVYLQQIVKDMIVGNFIYTCVRCKKLFRGSNIPINLIKSQPHCQICRPYCTKCKKRFTFRDGQPYHKCEPETAISSAPTEELEDVYSEELADYKEKHKGEAL